MAWIDQIAEHLEGLTIEGYTGTVFVQTMPSNTSPAIMLAAPQTGIKVDPEIRGLFKNGGFQMVVRAKKSSVAEDLAQSASDLLETETAFDLDTIQVRYIRPRHLPVPFPVSAGDYFEAVVNFDLCFAWL